MTTFVRATLLVVCVLVSADAQEGLLVSAFDKPVPETRQDLLSIQRAAIEIAKKVVPCTVGLQLREAMGSGVVISEDGYILTAAHVVSRPGRQVQIKFPDGRVAKGISLGMHTSADGALVKITDEGKWPFVPFVEKGQAPKIGDWCLATGHPSGFDRDRAPPVRVGRVIDIKPTVLRTDCPITGGDSGGPLFDMQGRVIGIHSRITESLTENYHVPALVYREAWDELLASELYPKPIPSQFLAILDTNHDGQLTKDELDSSYHRRVFARLVDEFELDPSQGLSIEKVAADSFHWEKRSQARLDEVDDLRDLDNLALSSRDFVRGPRIGQVFESMLLHADKLTVRVYADGRRVALGTIVDSNGLIVTKASRLEHDDIKCLLPDGRKLPAELLATDDDYDLALIRVDATDLATPDWATTPMKTGAWVSVPNTGGRLASVGVIAVAPRKIEPTPVVLGIAIDIRVVNEALVERVFERTGAHRAGMLAGDIVVAVAGQQVTSVKQIRDALVDYRAGDSVIAVVRRNDEELELEVLLRSAADVQFDASRFSASHLRMSGRLSRRRDGFQSAFQMDAILKPELCGGPVVDVTGKVVGVTLARADRVATYGVSHEDLLPIVQRLRNESDSLTTTTVIKQPEVE